MASFDTWIQDLETRHLSDLRFAEVSRALRALSSTYIERRRTIHHGAALAGAGKRAAFALFYGPLHYLIVREVVQPNRRGRRAEICARRSGLWDWRLGRGMGGQDSTIRQAVAIDRTLVGRRGNTNLPAFRRDRPVAPGRYDFGCVAGMAGGIAGGVRRERVPADARDRLLQRFLERAARGDAVLVVEPVARRSRPGGARGSPRSQRQVAGRMNGAFAPSCPTSSRSWIAPPASTTAS